MGFSRLMAFVLFLGCSIPLLGAGNIELRDGRRISGEVTFGNGKVTVENSGSFLPGEVKQIVFQSRQPEASGSVSTREIGPVLEIASRAAAFESKHADAGGIVLLDDMNYRYRPDGTFTLTTHFIGRVKKEDHLRWADQASYFTEGRDRIRFITARSIAPDGTVHEADPTEAVVTKPQMSPGIFMSYKVISLRIPHVKIGSLVECQIEYEMYNPFHKEFFFPSSYFQTGDPVFTSILQITLPADRQLFWEAKNLTPEQEKPVVSTTPEGKTWRWKMDEVPPLIPEPAMPRGADGLKYIHCSLFEGWDKIHDWINVYWKTNTTPSPELASRTMEIIAGAASEDEKVARILHWIEKNIRYIIIKGDAATIYGSYPAHETVQKQFGCCVDKAMVFSAMLNAAGIRNGPLLINAGSHDLSPKVPTLEITHSISRITRSNGSKYYLDSTGYDFRYPSFPTVDQGRHCLDPFDRSFDFIPMQDPDENMVRWISSLSLRLDGTLVGTSKKIYTGELEVISRATWKSVKPSEREQRLSQRVNGYSKGAVLDNASFTNLEAIEKPFEYEYSFTIPSYPREIADLLIVPIPGFLKSFSFPEAALATRAFDIEYDSTEALFEEGSLAIPPELSIRSLPQPLVLKTPAFDFSAEFSKGPGDRVDYKVSYRRRQKRVPREAYPEFKAAIARIQAYSRQMVFLKRVPQGGGS